MDSSVTEGTTPAQDIFYFTVDLAVVFCPCMGYIIQGTKFFRTNSTKGFQIYLSMLLIFTSSLRIFFWFGIGFTMALLFQSVIVMLSQIFIVHCYVKIRNKYDIEEETIENENQNNNENIEQRSFLTSLKILGLDILSYLKNFWHWREEYQYIKAIIIFETIMFFICQIIGFDKAWFFHILGAISTGVESVTSAPQIIKTCKTKNARNVSLIMVSFWMIGDIFRTCFYILSKSPVQFICAGIFQAALSTTLSILVCIYGSEIEYLKNLIFNRNSENAENKGNCSKADEEKAKLMGESEDNENSSSTQDQVNIKKETNSESNESGRNKSLFAEDEININVEL